MTNATILIIEDNEQNLYLMKFILEKNGFKVVEARDGQQGIRSAYELLPDMILIDIQLPLIDGYSVTMELRKNKALEKTPIIAVTSYTMPGDRENILRAGATDYIEKPIDPDTFVRGLIKYLGKDLHQKRE